MQLRKTNSKPVIEIEPIDLFGLTLRPAALPIEAVAEPEPIVAAEPVQAALATAAAAGVESVYVGVSAVSLDRTLTPVSGVVVPVDLSFLDDLEPLPTLFEAEPAPYCSTVAAVPVLEEPVVTEVVLGAECRFPSPFYSVWREGDYVRSCIDTAKLPLVIRRIPHYLVLSPYTLEATAQLVVLMRHSALEDHPSLRLNQPKEAGGQTTLEIREYDLVAQMTDGKSLVEADVLQDLVSCGFDIVIPPSVARWAQRAARRRRREQTPFDLPVPNDDRPLFDRLELGMLVQCIQDYRDNGATFLSGYSYIVTDTDQIELSDEDTDTTETQKAVEEGTGRITFTREGTGETTQWSALDPEMEGYLQLSSDTGKVFDPSEAFPVQFPELYEKALADLWARFPAYSEDGREKTPLFEHAYKDLAQAIYYRRIAFTHPPRMGKTSMAFGYLEAVKPKHALLSTVDNGIRVFVKEMRRLGITDYTVIRNLADLSNPARYHIVSHTWLKTTGRKKPANQHTRLSATRKCPHCDSTLMRFNREIVKREDRIVRDENGLPHLVWTWNVLDGERRHDKTEGYGYLCSNVECRGRSGVLTVDRTRSFVAKKCSNYGQHLFGPGGPTPDVDLKQHLLCIDRGLDKFRRGSRQCSNCGYVHKAWMPARYKRIGKRYSAIVVDEIHHIKASDARTDVWQAIMGTMKAKRRIGMSGTMMPTKPRDCYYPFAWTFGNENHLFEFQHGRKGVQEFNREYTQTVTMVSSNNTQYKKAIPYLKKPHQFAQWRSKRTLFRHYADEEAMASLRKAGLVIPQLKAIPVELLPDPRQGILLVATIAEFDERFRAYNEELRRRAAESEEGRAHLVNSSQVLARMTNMKYASSLPGLLNERIIAGGGQSIYTGPYGGVKAQFILDKVEEKTAKGEKVVIFSDHKAMQTLLGDLLKLYNPILFNTGWGRNRRDQAFAEFEENDDVGVFICGPRSVNESIDLSCEGKCRTVISPDLLWSPGLQTQAWSRILTPKSVERECELYILLTKFSIDSHIYSTFYGRIAASDQAMYGKLLTKADRGFDVQYFVDQVLSELPAVRQWVIDSGIQDLEFLPAFHMLTQLAARGEE